MCLIKLVAYFLFISLNVVLVNSQSTASERTIQNPGFVELSPCTCDISTELCDLNCCCDADCTSQDKARFVSCIPGLKGGQGGSTEDYKCGTSAFNPPDWHALTCVYWENNAYLGMFFMNKAKINNEIAFTTASNKYMKNEFSLRESERRYVVKDPAVTEYKKGEIVTTWQPSISALATPFARGLLSLPQHINGGQCNAMAPVRFLEPVQSSCQSTLTTSSCASLTAFSADIYVVSSAINSGNRPFQVTSTLLGQTLADAEVSYYCTATADNSAYLPSTTGSLGGLSSTTRSSFPNTLQTANCEDPCSDATCWQYNTNRASTSVYTRPLPPRCAFDNGMTLPPSPTMAAGGATCQNAVLEVRYAFEWSGTAITKLTASVVLGAISVTASTPTTLAQRFSVQWTHSSNATTTTANDNYFNSSQPYPRSGIAGYEPQTPLQSGCQQTNATTNQFQSVDIQAEKTMGVFRPGVDGLCANAQREPLSFGEDVLSSCALRLALSDLTSCANLRQLVGNHLNVLMPSNVIGRYGYNDPSNQDMWISLVRQNLTALYQSAVTPTNTPSTLLGNETAFRLADNIAGICLLPTAVNLVVLYAKTGAINFHPRLEVVGAYVNYTLGNWTMDCTGSNSDRCSATSGKVQSFFLSSTVRFVQVPPVPPTPKTRFYSRHDPETCDSDTCYRFFTDWDTEVCYYDTCWQQIAYPLTSLYQGDSHEYALAMFLLLVLGIVGYASVTKPGL